MFFNDFKRIKKLGKFLTKDKKTIYLILIVLLPVSFSGAIQPLLVGQAITILKNESTDVWLSKTFFGQSINGIILTLSVTVFFSMLPTTAEVLKRLPPNDPFVESLEDPLVLNLYIAYFIIYALFAIYQIFLIKGGSYND